VARGYNNREIAEALAITEGTAKNYVSSILAKMGVRDGRAPSSRRSKLVTCDADLVGSPSCDRFDLRTLMAIFWQDIRYSLRLLGKRPGSRLQWS